MRIRSIDGTVRGLGQDVQLHLGQLLLETADNRCGQHDIADGTETDEKYLFQNAINMQQR